MSLGKGSEHIAGSSNLSTAQEKEKMKKERKKKGNYTKLCVAQETHTKLASLWPLM